MNVSETLVLCHINDIAEGASKSIQIGELNLFAVKKHNKIYLYQNQCPHAGLPLNWFPDKFLDRDNELIQCSAHGALFQIETGRCVAGPCPGRHLKSLDYVISEDDQLILKKN